MTRSTFLKRAVFLDRDGTLNVEKNYLIHPQDFEFIPGVPAALKKLQDAGFLLVVVTNQSGIARGYFTVSQLNNLHRFMEEALATYDVTLDGIYFCPHHPIEGKNRYCRPCNCRKGKPGMLLQAAADLKIDLSQSIMIGDSCTDMEAGAAVGCRCYFVRTGYGKQGLQNGDQFNAQVVADLSIAVERILDE